MSAGSVGKKKQCPCALFLTPPSGHACLRIYNVSELILVLSAVVQST